MDSAGTRRQHGGEAASSPKAVPEDSASAGTRDPTCRAYRQGKDHPEGSSALLLADSVPGCG